MKFTVSIMTICGRSVFSHVAKDDVLCTGYLTTNARLRYSNVMIMIYEKNNKEEERRRDDSTRQRLYTPDERTQDLSPNESHVSAVMFLWVT